jgi:copper chaperone CopZ
MKLSILLLVLAGAVLAWIALRAQTPTYVPPVLANEAPAEVPLAIISAIPAGHVVHSFDVVGMCCNGCTAKLYQALLDVPDVKQAAVSFDHARAQALVPSDMQVDVLVQALAFDKYTATLQ